MITMPAPSDPGRDPVSRIGPASEPGEGALLEALLAGDRAAAERLVERTYALVFASLVRLCGNRDIAADLTQETYRKAWTSLAQFQRGSKFSTWLYRIAYNTYLNFVRRPAPVEPLEEHHASFARDRAPDAVDVLAEAQSSERLRRAVLGLPDPLRWVVTCHFWAEVSVPEIAALENVTQPAIRKRLKKAMTTLRRDLERGSAA